MKVKSSHTYCGPRTPKKVNKLFVLDIAWSNANQKVFEE